MQTTANTAAETLSAADAARYVGCGKAALIGWARRGCKLRSGAVVQLAYEMAGYRFRFRPTALDEFRAECAKAARGEPVAPLPPDPDLARRLAERDRVAAKLAGPVNGMKPRKPRAKAAR